MTDNEKIIAAFLVSMGLFSAPQAAHYVSTLSDGDKQALCEVQVIAKTIVFEDRARSSIDGTWEQDAASPKPDGGSSKLSA